MTSLRARLVRLLLENRHRLRGRPAPVFEVGSPIDDFRAEVEQSARRFAKPPKGVSVTPFELPGAEGETLAPISGGSDAAILYFHGGGYVAGSVASHRNIVAKVVRSTGIRALSFSYRLAPEHPFPAALDDALAAYAALQQWGVPAGRIVFAGDSAGAGLAVATLMALKERAEPLPAAAAVLSPWLDLAATSASAARPDPLAPRGSWQCFAAHYCAGQDPTNPLISPFYGDPTGLPPLFLSVGTDEHMHDEVTAFAEKARAAGVNVELIAGQDMVHCYPIMAPVFPEATKAFAAFTGFIRRHAD